MSETRGELEALVARCGLASQGGPAADVPEAVR